MDESTTDAVVQEQAASQPQPEGQPAEAELTPTSEPTPTPAPSAPTTEPVSTDNSAEAKEATAEWLASKGLDPNDPQAFQKAANMAFNSEKLMSRSRQQSQLAQQLSNEPIEVNTDNALLAQLVEDNIRQRRIAAINDFIRDNNVTPEQDEAMGKWLDDNEDVKALVFSGQLSLEQAFKLSGVGEADRATIEANAAKQALENLASKQLSTAPASAAANQAPPVSAEEDALMEVLQSD